MPPGWGKAIFLFELQNYQLACTFPFPNSSINFSPFIHPTPLCLLKSGKCTKHDSTMAAGYPWHYCHNSPMPMTSSYSAHILPNGIRVNWIRRCPANNWTNRAKNLSAFCLSTSLFSCHHLSQSKLFTEICAKTLQDSRDFHSARDPLDSLSWLPPLSPLDGEYLNSSTLWSQDIWQGTQEGFVPSLTEASVSFLNCLTPRAWVSSRHPLPNPKWRLSLQCVGSK